jgi:hypothetical protein
MKTVTPLAREAGNDLRASARTRERLRQSGASSGARVVRAHQNAPPALIPIAECQRETVRALTASPSGEIVTLKNKKSRRRQVVKTGAVHTRARNIPVR